jgi:CheY-like chemotaxis protein
MTDATRVLVVDDSQSVRRAIGRMLAPRGLAVAEAADGRQALERLAEGRPDLVISDVMLPQLDGYEVCRVVRGRRGLAGVPVLLISGVCSPEVERRAAAAGAAGVLAKPFTAEALVARVEALLPGVPAAATEHPDDLPPALLAALEELPGLRGAWLLEAEGGRARHLAGGPLPPDLLDLVRRAGELTAEVGLGGVRGLVLEGEAGALLVERLGRAAIAVCFERDVLLGLARHQVRQLRWRAERTSLPEGASNGDRPR